jgi:3-deoxy-7-phosphoheptulonate synthase
MTPRLVDRSLQQERTVVKVGNASIGSSEFAVIAGPCAVESREQLLMAAHAVKDAGATILRGDIFKPRTSPYAFQGLGLEALEILQEARSETGLPFVVEVVDPRHVQAVVEVADMIRIGTRNMANYALLKEVGMQAVPLLLKRGWTATIDEWLHAAEYIYSEGNHDIVMVERGIRTFETTTRSTLDISAIPIIKQESHLPILVDPSHSSGRSDLVAPLSRAAVAAGAHGILIDVHPDPQRALVDGDQALRPDEFATLVSELRVIAAVVSDD